MNKGIAGKILNNSFVEEIKKTLNGLGVEEAKPVIKKLVDSAVQKMISKTGRRIAVIITVITGIFTLLTIIITQSAGGNVFVPPIISIILLAAVWIIILMLSSLIARKVSSVIYKTVESKISQYKNGEGFEQRN